MRFFGTISRTREREMLNYIVLLKEKKIKEKLLKKECQNCVVNFMYNFYIGDKVRKLAISEKIIFLIFLRNSGSSFCPIIGHFEATQVVN